MIAQIIGGGFNQGSDLIRRQIGIGVSHQSDHASDMRVAMLVPPIAKKAGKQS